MFSTAQSFSKTLDGVKLQLEFGDGCERAFDHGSDAESQQKLGEELVGHAKRLDEDLAKLIAGIAFLATDAALQKRVAALLHQMRHRLRQAYPLEMMVDDGAEDALDEAQWEINVGAFGKMKAKFSDEIDDLAPLVAAHESLVLSERRTSPTPTPAKQKRTRQRVPDNTLTAKQLQAVETYADCECNYVRAAARLGISRAAAIERIQRAYEKLGQQVPKVGAKSKTRPLPLDHRGNVDESDDRRHV